MITYIQEVYNVYKVDILNVKTNRTFDNYLIKIPENQLAGTEKRIHESHPHHILKVTFTKK